MKSHMFTELLKEIPDDIARLASELHYQGTQHITSEVFIPSTQIDDLFSITDGKLQFASLAARNHCTAIHSLRKFEDLGLPLNARHVFDEAHELWRHEINHSDFASGRFLGLMSDRLNILQVGAEIISHSEVHDVFGILRNIGNALPFLQNLTITDLAYLASVQYIKTSGDMLAGMIFNDISNFLSEHSYFAKELYAYARENLTATNANLYGAALNGLAASGQIREATELALADTESESNELVAAALWALGRLARHWENESDLIERIQPILKIMGYHSDSSINLQAWQAMSNAAVTQPEWITELLIHAQPQNQAALQVLDNFVFLNFETVKAHAKLPAILSALTNLDVGFKYNFNYSLSRLIEAGDHDQLVYDCLTSWVIKHYDDKASDEILMACFDQAIMTLADKPLLNELITRWLVADEQTLGRAYSDLVGHLWVHRVKQPKFAKNILDSLNDEDFKYLARRLLGWTFHEEALLSLALSLLDTEDAPQRTFGWTHALLVNDIGRDYPQATLQAIEEKLQDALPEVAQLLREIQTKLLAYKAAISELPVRHELYPPVPVRIRHAVALKKEKEYRESNEKASKNSIWQQLCTTTPLKAGTGSFSLREGKLGEINRLASYSHSITLPAQYIIDPVNDEISKLGFRIAKRGDE